MGTLAGLVDAVLFDLDGTLIDTDDVAARELAQRLRPIAGAAAPRLARRLIMNVETPGNALITLLDRLHLDAPLMGFKERLRERAPEPPRYTLVPGVEEMVAGLAAHYPVALVTTRSRRAIDAFLAQFPQIAGAVQTSCGLQDTRRLKPHPAPVLLAAERLGVAPARCVMVGDTTVDVRAARRAGAWSVAVLCGFGERRELERAGAHLVLDTTAEVGHWLVPA